MNEWDEREGGELDVIADAVRSYPLAPVPTGLSSSIMARIHEATPAPRFELKWIDIALGLFGASMTALTWLLLWQWLPNAADWPSDLLFSAILPLDTMDIALGAIGLIGGLLALGVCLVIALVVLVPRPVIEVEPVSR